MLSSSTLSRAAIVGLSLFTVACKSEAHDLREWQPSDHDHTSEPAAQGQVDVSDPATNPLAAHGISEVVLLGWRQNCVRCHGVIGRGDGSQAAATRPPDLTNPERQAQLSDTDIRTVIRQGRGLMPAHDLPDSTIDGLVKLVRLLNASGKAMAEAPAGSAAPTGSTAAPPSSAAASSAAAGSAATTRPPAGGSRPNFGGPPPPPGPSAPPAQPAP